MKKINPVGKTYLTKEGNFIIIGENETLYIRSRDDGRKMSPILKICLRDGLIDGSIDTTDKANVIRYFDGMSMFRYFRVINRHIVSVYEYK